MSLLENVPPTPLLYIILPLPQWGICSRMHMTPPYLVSQKFILIFLSTVVCTRFCSMKLETKLCLNRGDLRALKLGIPVIAFTIPFQLEKK